MDKVFNLIYKLKIISEKVNKKSAYVTKEGT